MKILIVDDSPTGQIVIQALLKSSGFEDIATANNPLEAFKILGMDSGLPNPEEVDLILMDYMMPHMNGVDATKKIQSYPILKDIPIIMLTSDKQDSTLQDAFDAGAVDFITTPISKVELLARMKSIITLKQEVHKRKARELDLLTITAELEESNKQLKLISTLDGLTSIANRRSFDEFLEKEWRRAIREQSGLSLVILDVDFFKRYNDKYGHPAGDECLKTVAETLKSLLHRANDMVARYGGEEFAVVMGSTSLEDALKLAEKLRAAVEGCNIQHELSDCDEMVTISLGVSYMMPKKDESPSALIDMADMALYQAKNQGRNRVKSSTFL